MKGHIFSPIGGCKWQPVIDRSLALTAQQSDNMSHKIMQSCRYICMFDVIWQESMNPVADVIHPHSPAFSYTGTCSASDRALRVGFINLDSAPYQISPLLLIVSRTICLLLGFLINLLSSLWGFWNCVQFIRDIEFYESVDSTTNWHPSCLVFQFFSILFITLSPFRCR